MFIDSSDGLKEPFRLRNFVNLLPFFTNNVGTRRCHENIKSCGRSSACKSKSLTMDFCDCLKVLRNVPLLDYSFLRALVSSVQRCKERILCQDLRCISCFADK